MKKNIRISEPSEEMMEKIRKARHAIANQNEYAAPGRTP